MSGRIPHDSTDDEDEFLVPENTNTSAVSSRLGSLFSHTTKTEGNASLIYKAPKQPVLKEENPPDQQKASTATDADGVPVRVLHATTAHAFLLKDGQYVSQGKIGVAVLGNRSKKDYKILLYMSNKQPIGQATISTGLNINIKINNYVCFNDDRTANWSLAFENENQMVEFLKWILAVKSVLFGEHHKEILPLDIEEGEGSSVGEGDSLEIEYTEFLIEDGPAITEFNGNLNTNQKPLRVKLGKGEAPKGWMDGLVGMKKRGKRIFIIPPDLGYSGHDSNPSFPINTPLMVYAIVKRVKFSNKQLGTATGNKEESIRERKLSTESEVSATSNFEITNESLESVGDGAGTQKSASESDVHKKSDLIHRMARIGHAVMGAPPPVATSGSSDSYENGTTSAILPAKPMAPPRPSTLQNPLAIVCADVSLARPVITQTTANVTKSSSDGSISPRSRIGATTTTSVGSQLLSHSNQQHPFEMNMIPLSYPPMTTSTNPVMPYMYPFPYPPQSYFLQPPFMPPACPPSSTTSDFSSVATSADKQFIVEEIQKCHLQLQDALTKTLVNNLSNVLKKCTDMNENVEKKFDQLCSKNVATDEGTTEPKSVSTDGGLMEMMSKLDQMDILIRNQPTTNLEPMLVKLTEFGEQIQRMENDMKTLPTGGASGNGGDGTNAQFSSSLAINRLEVLTEKMSSLQTAIDNINAMRSDLTTGNEWKDKHEKLKSQALAMKEKYEGRIQELEEELQQKGDGQVGSGTMEKEKVKKIMSTFYKNVCQRFPSGEHFDSDMVRQIILESVKESTLHVLNEETSQIVEPEERSVPDGETKDEDGSGGGNPEEPLFTGAEEDSSKGEENLVNTEEKHESE